MSMSSEYGLVVFVDATPSEQLRKQRDEILCLTGVFVDDPAGLPGLKQYKERRGERRLQMAANLSRAISNGRPGILASGAFARMDCVEVYGDRILRKLRNVTVDGDDYVVEGSTLHRNNAIAAGWYVAALASIAASAAGWAKDSKQRKVALFVDQFPGVSETTMKLLTRGVSEGEVREQWEELRPRLEVSEIYVDTLESFDVRGKRRSGKDHPHAVLADWISHSLYAKQNPAELLDGAAGRSPEYKDAISEPWNILEKCGAAVAGTLDEWTHKNDTDV